MGHITPQVSYRLLASYRYSWGTPYVPSLSKTHDTSASIEGKYQPKSIPGLSIKAQLAIDRGSLLGDNFGGLVTVSYEGLLNI